MTFAETLKYGVKILTDAGVENPAFEAALLLSSIIKKDKSYIFSHPEKEISEQDFSSYSLNISKRAEHVPAQYILGNQEFMALDFLVSPAVLIPRPETELLAEAAIEYIKHNAEKYCSSLGNQGSSQGSCGRDFKILDIGTGSGCLAVSVARYCKNCRVTAVDISPEALSVAAENAELNGVLDRIEFVESDLFEAVGNRKFDVIISNPPYIPTEDIPKLDPEVRKHEPGKALDGGPAGLDVIRRIIERAPDYLNEEGMLAIEIGIGQNEAVQKLMGFKFNRIEVLTDLQRIPRAVKGIIS